METNQKSYIMWTAQTSEVSGKLYKDGVIYVKKEYIKKKYGEVSWIFETAYAYFIKHLKSCVEKPEEAQSPVWLFQDPRWAIPGQDAELLRVTVPADQMLLFDRKKWSQILSLSYVGTEEERILFDKEMKRQGISDAADVFIKPFYPAMKNKIIKSWDSVFDIDGLGDTDIQGAVWCLKKEWLGTGHF